jgi:hypothetical protein
MSLASESMSKDYSRQKFLYERARELLLTTWRLVPLQADEKYRGFGKIENTFRDSESGCIINLIVPPRIKTWTVEHTMGAEKGLLKRNGFTVIIVQGEVDEEALRLNLRSHSRVHVISDLVLTNAVTPGPVLVEADNFLLQSVSVKSVDELKQVRSSAPEVQLLRAMRGDVIAYPPTACPGPCRPSGQVDDWALRVVVV